MKKILLAAVVAATLSLSSQASASTVAATSATLSPIVVATPEVDTLASRRGPIRSILGRLLELERRKNAWLRRTFS